MRTNTAFLAASTLFLSLTLACGGGGGGGSTPPPAGKTIADTLTYTDPSGTGFRLIRNSGSTAGNLVLDLVGPSGTGQGVAFIFNADQTKVTWANPAASNVAFTLGSGTQAFIAKTSGNVLQAAAFQKPGATAINLAQPLLRLSLALKSNIPVNTAVTLSVTGANQLATSGGAPATITVAVGTLVAQ